MSIVLRPRRSFDEAVPQSLLELRDQVVAGMDVRVILEKNGGASAARELRVDARGRFEVDDLAITLRLRR